jgi:phosphopantothenoylcysteine decarboxylase/phosphopantothenate--cysteine ligase
MAHINLSREADAILVAPASADFIAKLVQGRADDLLSLMCLARPIERCPLLVAPAMNREMWAHPATQRNVAQAQADGCDAARARRRRAGLPRVRRGPHARGARAARRADRVLPAQAARGRRVLVTAGPDFEAIDPVRGITNLSSGKMGFAIARARAEAGADGHARRGPVHLPTPCGVRASTSTSAREMHAAVLPAARSRTSRRDARGGRLASRADDAHKIKKDGKKVAPQFELTENPDILADVARLAPRPYCVGFAAESENLLQHARESSRARTCR